MFETALQLRADIRAFLGMRSGRAAAQCERVRACSTRRLKQFPLVAEAQGERGFALRASRDDALAGLSVVVAELYDGSIQGTLDRLKMCAAEECRRVFYDRSKPATRRWCMSTLCGNRIKTRTYRARHRDAG